MTRTGLCLAILGVLVAGGVQAGIYKTVGPDGKVSYSDHPPEAADAQYDVVGKTAPAREESSAKAPAAEPAAVVRSLGDKRPINKATRAGSQPLASTPAAADVVPVSASSASQPAALEGAIIGVLGIEDIVRQTEDLCAKTLPAAFGKYAQAAAEWRQRNHVVVMQAHHAIAQGFNAANGADAEQRIENAVRAKNQSMFQPILQASTADKIRWCDNSVEEIHSGSMDVAGKPKLTEPLRGYR